MTALAAPGAQLSRLDEPLRADRGTDAHSATRRTVSVLGAVIALAGVEHGVGEILQGNVAPGGTAIESWPGAAAFRVLSGEPAVTVVPNLLATGVLAVLVSACVGVWAAAFVQRRHGGPVLVLLSVAMLLVGGGIGPPLIGVVLGLTATRIGTPLPWWRARPPGGAGRWLVASWPWILGADVAAWLAVVPGAVLAGSWFGADAVPSALVYGLLAAALLLLPLSIVAAFSHDARAQPALAPAPDRVRPRGRARRGAFFALAAGMSLLLWLTFVATTVLTVGLWLAGRNNDTNPVVDLGFFALGGVVIASGFTAQLRAPEPGIAGIQQAVVALLALGVAGLIGGRVEPLAGAVVLLVPALALLALHPARGAFFRTGACPSLSLAALAVAGAVPAAPYAAAMLAWAREAGPSCFFGACAYGDRFAEMAALAVAVVGLSVLAALRTEGSRMAAWCAGGATTIVGAASLVWPDLPGSLGRLAGAGTVIWGVLLVGLAEWGHSRGQYDRGTGVDRAKELVAA